MDGIGGILGGVVGLIGAGLQYSAQQEANQVAWANLNFQKQSADRNFRFSSAGRTDAYGNKQSYDEALNEWKTLLTPTQNQIVKAGETEQRKSLTEDAPRNRLIRENAYQRAQDAVPLYKQAIAGYKYDLPPSEDAIRSRIMDALSAGEQTAVNANKGVLETQALRLGRGGDIPAIIKAANDDLGSKLQGMEATARGQAVGEFAQRSQMHDQKYIPEIQMWDRIINEAAPDAAVQFSNVPAQLSQTEGQQAGLIEQALQSGANGVGGAYSALASSLGKSLDLSGIAKAFGGIGGAGRGATGKKSATGQDNGWWNSPEYQAWNNFDPFANGGTSGGQSGNYNFYTGAGQSFDNGSLF